MQFKKILCFSLKDYNKNKPKDDRYPQDGVVINCFYSPNLVTEFVAVGYAN